jgi:ribosome recycling factor
MTTIGSTKEATAAAKTRMEKAVDDFRKEIATLRTGRANATLLDGIRVDYHGTPMLVKHLHKVLENHRTAVRNVRRDIKESIDKLEKDKKISQDEQKRSLEELEKVSHAETKKMEDLSATKEKEIMGL